MNSTKTSFVQGLEKTSSGCGVVAAEIAKKTTPGFSTKSIFKTRVGKNLAGAGK
jgi:hypothetical protein